MAWSSIPESLSATRAQRAPRSRSGGNPQGSVARQIRRCVCRDAGVDLVRVQSCQAMGHHQVTELALVRSKSVERQACNDDGLFLFWGEAGRLRIGKDLQPCDGSKVYVIPARVGFGFRCERGGARRKAGWVRYSAIAVRALTGGTIAGPAAVLSTPDFLQVCLDGLFSEVMGENQQAATEAWIETIQVYCSRILRPFSKRPRLGEIWQAVRTNPDHTWTLNELAQVACMSLEHLRRTCREETGCTPMGHVTVLRIRRARHLLETTDIKISGVGRMVGYPDPTNFAAAFRRLMKCSPREYRSSRRST